MEASELREQTVEDLQEEILTLTKDRFNLRMQKSSAQLGQSHLLRQVRRDLARAKTILNEKLHNETNQNSGQEQ